MFSMCHSTWFVIAGMKSQESQEYLFSFWSIFSFNSVLTGERITSVGICRKAVDVNIFY